ncbi:MAG: FHIPEP family type III secretion protein [Phycisphaerales bacterium]|nr:FHIPEP family type III secretion protein [Phycisphaerales bacterium]
MSELAATLQTTGRFISRHRGLILPVGAASLIFVILVPIPPMLIDIFLAMNIAMAAIILLTTIHVRSPLEFNVFPSLLLGATLFRLVLNVATTRLILTAGADGAGSQQAAQAAGGVIYAFSSFVTSNSLAVGVILFVILVVIQFVVVTKGAARISEVAARFVLDAMPGKQMAIDSDLNAGIIDKEEARTRREEVANRADFYGAMDGASKFIRGDALAAMIITLVNVLGGFYVGMVQYQWGAGETAEVFTRLTVGDGLVTQIPAFLISISAALLVSRNTAKSNLGEDVVSQLTARPVVLGITAVFLAALTLTALPKVPLVILGLGCASLAWILSRKAQAEQDNSGQQNSADGDSSVRQPDVAVADLVAIDPLRIEIGYALVRLLDDASHDDMLSRISDLRRQIGMDLGLLVPQVAVRDNMRLGAHDYAMQIRGVTVAQGRIYPAQLLAVAQRATSGKLVGRETVDPISGLDAVWITEPQQRRAQQMGYTVSTPVNLLMNHLGRVITDNAAKLLSRRHVTEMLEAVGKRDQGLVDDATEKVQPYVIHKVLGRLLREGVSIRDMESILESLCQHASNADCPELLAECVRADLGVSLSRQYCQQDGKLWCVSLGAQAETALQEHITRGPSGVSMTAGPELTARVSAAVSDALGRLRETGKRPVVLCGPDVRIHLKQMLRTSDPDAAVLGYNEIESVEVQSLEHVGIDL